MKKEVELTAEIVRGEKKIKKIVLVQPTVMALKGLKMMDVIQMDVDAYVTLLPRISTPTLTKADITAMNPVDFTALATEIVSFFVKADKEAE